jgi:hypothetical protein
MEEKKKRQKVDEKTKSKRKDVEGKSVEKRLG